MSSTTIVFSKGTYLGSTSHLFNTDGAVASITTYPDPESCENRHCHENGHLSLVMQGGSVEKRNNKNIERLPGVVTIYEKGEPHLITQLAAGSKHLNIEIEDWFLKKYEIDPQTFGSHMIDNAWAKCMMLKLFQEVKAYDNHSCTSIHLLLSNLLHGGRRSNISPHTPSWIRNITALMHDRWNEIVTLDDLSQAAGVHPVTVSKYFPRHFGYSIGKYMRLLKVERAILLIKNTSLPLTEIALDCGFSDQSHFIKIFKQYTGFLPKQYQRI